MSGPSTGVAVSVVVPVYDEAESLPQLVAEITAALAGVPDRTYEVLFVDDCSRDDSLTVLRRLADDEPHLRILRHDRNCGQSAALASGFRAARGSIVVTLDADLQNDPADIPALLAELESCDMVSGVRSERHDSWVRRVSSRIANRVRNFVLRDGVTDVGCSLKAYRAELLSEIPVFNGMHRFLPALVRMRGARIREIPVRHRPRVHGESKYNIHNRLWRGLADLAAVRWMQRRSVAHRNVEEIDAQE